MTGSKQDDSVYFREELQQIRAENAQLKTMMDLFLNGPVVTFIWDNSPGWPVRHVSSNVKQIFGYSADDLCSGKILYADLIFQQDLKRVTSEVDTTLDPAVQIVDHQPYRIVHADGSLRWMQDKCRAVRDQNNVITHFNGYVLDITASMQVREKLETDRWRLKTLIDEIPAIVCIKDNAGRWLQANRTMLDLLQMMQVDYQGKSNEQLAQYISPELQAAFTTCAEYDRRAWRLGERMQVDITFPAASGAVVTFDVNKIPLFDEQGKPQVLLVIGYDITHRKQDEIKRLSQAEKQQKLFVGEVHHRIKNHLQGLIGLLRQHRHENGDNGFIDIAISQIASIAAVYGLQSHNVNAGIQLDQMLNAIIHSVQGMSGLPFDFAQPSTPGRLQLDRNKAVALALVINELVMNAVKHSVVDEHSAPISVYLELQQSCVVLTVKNPGRLPATFDLHTGVGLGTGLELAQAMLPGEGATLDIGEQQNQVVSRLIICPPLIDVLNEGQGMEK